MDIRHLFILLFIILCMDLINRYLNKIIEQEMEENFDNVNYNPNPGNGDYKPHLSNLVIEDGCRPPAKDLRPYSYKINEDYCFGDLFCKNKNDRCLNFHCIPSGVDPQNNYMQDCPDCVKPF